MSALETFRGVEISRTADVMGFAVQTRDAYCISVRVRGDDDAPLLDTFPTIEHCRVAIDEYWEERILDALEGLLGLVEIISQRDDLPSEIRVVLETNHRTIEAIDVIEAVSPTSLANTFARTWRDRMQIGAADGFRPEPLTASAVAGAVNLLDAMKVS